MMRAPARSVICLLACIVPSAAALVSCTKDEPKVVKDEPKKTTPVPEDMGSFNDFLPPSGGAAGLAVKLDGGGLEGGIAAAGAGGDEAPAVEDKLKVTEPGAEPRAQRRYTFAANRVEKRILTSTQEQSRGGQGGPALTLTMGLDFTPKQVKPTGSHWDVKVTKLEIPGAASMGPQGAQVAAALGQLKGTQGQFDLSPRGEAGEVSFAGDAKMKNPLAEGVVQGVSQAIELLVPPFPDAPIGLGAKWERVLDSSEGGVKQSSRQVFTLKELTAEGGVIDADITIKVPKRAIQARGLPPGTTVAIDGKGKYTYEFRFDRLSTKVVGTLDLVQHIEVVDETGKKQAIDEHQKAKHVIETPGAGGGASAAPKAPAPKAP